MRLSVSTPFLKQSPPIHTILNAEDSLEVHSFHYDFDLVLSSLIPASVTLVACQQSPGGKAEGREESPSIRPLLLRSASLSAGRCAGVATKGRPSAGVRAAALVARRARRAGAARGHQSAGPLARGAGLGGGSCVPGYERSSLLGG